MASDSFEKLSVLAKEELMFCPALKQMSVLLLIMVAKSDRALIAETRDEILKLATELTEAEWQQIRKYVPPDQPSYEWLCTLETLREFSKV